MSYAQVLDKLQKEMSASSRLRNESNRLQKENDSLKSQLKEKGRLLDSKDHELQLANVKANAEIAKLKEKLRGAYERIAEKKTPKVKNVPAPTLPVPGRKKIAKVCKAAEELRQFVEDFDANKQVIGRWTDKKAVRFCRLYLRSYAFDDYERFPRDDVDLLKSKLFGPQKSGGPFVFPPQPKLVGLKLFSKLKGNAVVVQNMVRLYQNYC
jgi:hypothetical protein